MADGRHPLFTW